MAGYKGKRVMRQKHKGKKILALLGVFFLIILLCWTLFAFSSIPFIKNLREIYIETAMSTFHHQWLATAFLPQSVIDEVVSSSNQQLEDNMIAESELPPAAAEINTEQSGQTLTPEYTESVSDPAQDAFFELFYEIDASTLPDSSSEWDYASLQYIDIESEGIRTTAGDNVWGIDSVNGILIVAVEGDGYKGKLAIIKDSSRVIMGMNRFTERGETVGEYCRDYDAILGINANAFGDTEGVGKGNILLGTAVSNGVIYSGSVGNYYQIGGFDYDDNFRVGYALQVSELRDAAQFMPIIVLNGENAVDGSFGLGIQPRTAIGQNTKKETLMLVVDGRQVGYSLGTTVSECAEIMLRYDCYNALCMDGGSSSSMVYDGELITSPSTPMETGRYLPCAWLVKKADAS